MQSTLIRAAVSRVPSFHSYRRFAALSSRCLSTEPSFAHTRAQELFERITEKCSREDIPLLAAELNKVLGRQFRAREFYYSGFGSGRGGRQGGGVVASSEEAPAEQTKTTVDLKLAAFDAKAKIKVIKEVRAITGLGLKEAKEMVEGAPKVIQQGIKPEEAEELKKKLEEIGATIELV